MNKFFLILCCLFIKDNLEPLGGQYLAKCNNFSVFTKHCHGCLTMCIISLIFFINNLNASHKLTDITFHM